MAENIKKQVVLSDRMQLLADMVTEGNCVADVGCDHAFLSIYLVQSGKAPACIAMDVRKGPLLAAKEHISFYGLDAYIETRLSDGLCAYHSREAQTMVCAGMGGPLMAKILSEGRQKARSFSELILQPQSEIPEFRAFLRKEGYEITEEGAVFEDGKFYFAMKAVYTGQVQQAKTELDDLFGEKLLQQKHPVLKQYLQNRLHTVMEIKNRLQQADTEKSGRRQQELLREQEQLLQALAAFEGKSEESVE